MKNFISYLIFFVFLFNIQLKANEISASQLNYDQVINIGKMISHDNKFTLFFRTRQKAILAKGEEINYIKDYPQDLYILDHNSGKISPVITYDWFPKKVKELGSNYNLPIFPEDFAYYLLNDNETLVMISGVKSIRSNYKFNLKNQKLQILSNDEKNKLRFVFSLLRNCGYQNIETTYKCLFYKPLISNNLIK
ncbi:hypothetical protein N8084_02870 [Pelagibacteraceae bacterium]|jgi:hypothetical protein|nr:hypothetical protein [Pelagibacteraceae bacterium]